MHISLQRCSMLDLRRLRLLYELHERGTIAAVADALHFTPSAVSQQLAVLEREAGVTLLERAGRGVRLTDPALVLVAPRRRAARARRARRGRARGRRRRRRRARADRGVPVGRAAPGAARHAGARARRARAALRARRGRAGAVAAGARARRHRPRAGRRVAAPGAPAARGRRAARPAPRPDPHRPGPRVIRPRAGTAPRCRCASLPARVGRPAIAERPGRG